MILAKIHGSVLGKTWFKVLKPRERRDEIVAIEATMNWWGRGAVLISDEGQVSDIDLWAVEFNAQSHTKSLWAVDSSGDQ